MTKFSIILPTYNVGQYIDRCLISCTNQTYSDFEIIIVDDCGQDDAMDKAKLWAKQDSRIKILHHEKNLGTYHARYTGVKAAHGDYVIFLDPDDALVLNALDQLSKLISAATDIILFGSRLIPEKNCFQVQSAVPILSDYNATNSEIINLLNFKGFSLGTLGKAYNKEIISKAFEKLNVPITNRLIFGEDALLFSEVITNAKILKSTQEEIYLYYQGETSITKSTDLNTIIRNIDNLNYVIFRLKAQVSSSPKKHIAYNICITRLSADLLVLENKTNISFLKVMKNYFNLMVLTKKFRWVIRASLYLFSFGKII